LTRRPAASRPSVVRASVSATTSKRAATAVDRRQADAVDRDRVAARRRGGLGLDDEPAVPSKLTTRPTSRTIPVNTRYSP
jgi:hypothetical protein